MFWTIEVNPQYGDSISVAQALEQDRTHISLLWSFKGRLYKNHLCTSCSQFLPARKLMLMGRQRVAERWRDGASKIPKGGLIKSLLL